MNRGLRKTLKTKGVFQNDDSVLKILYLSLKRLSARWAAPFPQLEKNIELTDSQIRSESPCENHEISFAKTQKTKYIFFRFFMRKKNDFHKILNKLQIAFIVENPIHRNLLCQLQIHLQNVGVALVFKGIRYLFHRFFQRKSVFSLTDRHSHAIFIYPLISLTFLGLLKK